MSLVIEKTKENKKSVHTQLTDELRSQALRMATGDKLPSENMLCRRYQLARMTVSKALNELVNEGIVYRKQGKGTFVNEPTATPVYFLIPYAGTLQSGNVALNGVYSGVLQEAKERNIKTELLVASPTNQRKDIDWELFNSMRPGSKILIYGFWFARLFDLLKAKNCRVVFINPQWECEEALAAITSSWYSLVIDRVNAIHRVIKYLHNTGCGRVAFIHNISHCMNPFILGYEQALKNEGVSLCRQLTIYCLDTYLDAYNNVDNMLLLRDKYPFDAIITSTPNQMLGAIQSLLDNSIKTPGEVALFCLQDDSSIEHGALPISALNIPYYETGRRAMRVFASHSYDSGREIIQCDIIERASTLLKPKNKEFVK